MKIIQLSALLKVYCVICYNICGISRLSFIGRLLCKAPVNLLETERYINFNIIIIIIIILPSASNTICPLSLSTVGLVRIDS